MTFGKKLGVEFCVIVGVNHVYVVVDCLDTLLHFCKIRLSIVIHMILS